MEGEKTEREINTRGGSDKGKWGTQKNRKGEGKVSGMEGLEGERTKLFCLHLSQK